MSVYKNAILFYNTKSGHSRKGRQLDQIKTHFEKHNIPLEIIEFPVPGENILKTVGQINAENADLFIAAGGDGTISLLSNQLINTDKPLGIIPLGTGNLLAQELKIPLNLDKALAIITNENSNTFVMDTIMLEDRRCLLNVSVGLIPKVMKSTKSKEKQRFGIFAYIVNFFQQFLGLKRHRFFIDYDQKKISFTASEVLITNGRSAGVESLKFSENIGIDDGHLDLFIIRATNLYDVINLVVSLFSKKDRQDDIMKHIQFSDFCRIETQTPLAIQADGDTIGETPVEIKILPKSLRIIVNKNFNY